MTYNVFSGTLNPTQSINQSINHHHHVYVLYKTQYKAIILEKIRTVLTRLKAPTANLSSYKNYSNAIKINIKI